MSGFVTLVGAGPGDPGLLTVKGRKALEQAEVVVYDALVGDGIMSLIPADAELIDVGKRSGNHTVPQEGINRILVEKAQEGKRVVRLKGGDPFLFGRGGEELEELHAAGVDFQEIPGVTSAISAPAYAGIPVTHRDFASSLHIITGHKRAGKELDIDFEALVRTGGTLVFLMGVSALPEICAGLLSAGMDPDLPASIIEQGSTPHQRRVDATAGTLAEKAAAEHVKAPAISVFGGVCGLGNKLDWFDRLPLKGKRIVVTRPKERIGTLSRRLRELGADVLEYPCIETRPVVPCPPLEEALTLLHNYQWLVLTSPAGAKYLWDELRREGKDARALAGIKIAAIGPGTAGVLAKHGLTADYIPPVYDACHLAQGLIELEARNVLMLRADIATPELPDTLREAFVSYLDIAIYNTVYTSDRAEGLRKELSSGTVDMVTFTSASTVQGFVSSVGEDFDFSTINAICIGIQTEAEAKKYNMHTQVAEKATLDDMINVMRRV